MSDVLTKLQPMKTQLLFWPVLMYVVHEPTVCSRGADALAWPDCYSWPVCYSPKLPTCCRIGGETAETVIGCSKRPYAKTVLHYVKQPHGCSVSHEPGTPRQLSCWCEGVQCRIN
jgi:hypothetical protein